MALTDPSFSMEKKGRYVNADKLNELTEDPETIVVDMRNHYEYEVGHFENAIEIPSDTFREQLPMAAGYAEGCERLKISSCIAPVVSAAKRPVHICCTRDLKMFFTWKAVLSIMLIR